MQDQGSFSFSAKHDSPASFLRDTELLYSAQRHAASCGFFLSCHQPQSFISLPQDLCSSTNSQSNYGYEKLEQEDSMQL